MTGPYWKLWHDASGRFFLALALLTLALLGVFGANRAAMKPRMCVAAPAGDSWSAVRARMVAEYADAQKNPGSFYRPGHQIYTPQMIADADLLAARCAIGQHPNPKYAYDVQFITQEYTDVIWGGMMPYLLLFLGILLSVGPPFSGESMEAFALTFSLPWSRDRWLFGKVTMSVILLAALTAVVAIATTLMSYHPHVTGLSGGYPEMPPIIYPTFGMILRAFLAGIVGISLGTAASMYSRNILTATVAAGLIAYALVAIKFRWTMMDDRTSFLSFSYDFQVLHAFAIICCAALFATVRLRRTDY